MSTKLSETFRVRPRTADDEARDDELERNGAVEPMTKIEAYHEPREELDTETVDLERAMQSMKEELDAISWYSERIDATSDEELMAIMVHNRDEEATHASDLYAYICGKDPAFEDEVEEMVEGPEFDVKMMEPGGETSTVTFPEDGQQADSGQFSQDMSHGFGKVERSINDLKDALESMDVSQKEEIYELLDELGDHVSEMFRYIVDGKKMQRWVRNDEDQSFQTSYPEAGNAETQDYSGDPEEE